MVSPDRSVKEEDLGMARKSADGASGATRAEKTRERLLDAAEALLREGGLPAATVPAIAERAGLAVGNVYKRFPDKDGLLREVFLRLEARASAGNARDLDRTRRSAEPIGTLVHRGARAAAEDYARNRYLYAALREFSEHQSDPLFGRRLIDLQRRTLRGASRILLDRRAQMAHPDPERAVTFILTAAASAIRDVMLSPHPPRRYLDDPDWFAGELTRMVLGYLGLPADSVADEEAGDGDPRKSSRRIRDPNARGRLGSSLT